MQTLFKPATALMDRLRYSGKFALMGVAILVVMVVLLLTVLQSLTHEIRTAEHELEGLHMLKDMNRMTQFIQQHRGLSSGLLNGNEAMKEPRAKKEKEVEEAYQAAEKALSPALRDSASWKAIAADWTAIRTTGLTWTPLDNIKRHGQIVDKILLFMVELADAQELTLDPVIDTYYMMDTVVIKMPIMLESLGITRARGTGILSKKVLTQEQRIDMVAMMGQMQNTLRAQTINLNKVGLYAPYLKNTLETANKHFTDSTHQVFQLIRDDILTERFSTPSGDYFALTTKLINDGYQMMYETLMPSFSTQLNNRLAEKQRTLWLNAGLAVGVMLLVIYLAVGAYYSVVNSVDVFRNGARRLADGDLTTRFVTTGHDELHEAGNDFNLMADSIRQLLSRIQTDVAQLRQSAAHLAQASVQISGSTAEQSDAASSMAASVEEMTVGVDNIAKNAQDAQGYASASDEVAARGGSIVHGVVQQIQGIADTVNQSAAAVEALGQQSQQISAIIETIKEIADQTNLLALNAAIEAARAGESGRGFAVVADEVRKLAERTGKSTQEIANMIAAIQSGTEHAVTSMKQGVSRVAAGVAQAEEAGGTMAQVQSQAAYVRNSVTEISAALREQSAASTGIALNVERIAQVAESNNAVARANAGTADNLRQLAETLSEEVSRFRT